MLGCGQWFQPGEEEPFLLADHSSVMLGLAYRYQGYTRSGAGDLLVTAADL